MTLYLHLTLSRSPYNRELLHVLICVAGPPQASLTDGQTSQRKVASSQKSRATMRVFQPGQQVNGRATQYQG